MPTENVRENALHGRDRETRTIAGIAGEIDPRTLMVIGPSGSGKTATVMHALRGLGPEVPVLRVQRIWSRRPHARFLGDTDRSDLAVLPSGTDGNSTTGFFESVIENLGGIIPRVVFVDDAGVLTEERLSWLHRLADEAFALDCRVVVAAEELAHDVLPDELDVLRLGPLDATALRHFLTDALGLAIAADVVERITWWSAGNPRLALELAQDLSVAQLRGGALWHGPDAAGSAAQRTYRHLLEKIDESGADLLASFVLRQPGSSLGEEPWDGAAGLGDDPTLRRLADLGLAEARGDTWFLRHPLVAVLCAERNGADRPAAPTAERKSEAMLRGLHMQELNPALRAGPLSVACPKNRALAFTVSVLTGQTWGVPRVGPSGADDCRDWAEHVWWRAAGGAPEPVREASRRLAAAALAVEAEGTVHDPDQLRADLERVGETAGQHWLGLHLQTRMRLMLGDVSGARALVAAHVNDDVRGAAEQVARSVSAAMLAAVEGQFHDVRRHLDAVRRLRPGCDGWLVLRGLTALADAAIDGRVPDVGVPDVLGNWSARAAAEFAADVGAAHLLLGRAREAVSLLAVSTEQCRWPYQCPVMVRADLVDAAVSAGDIQALPAAIGGGTAVAERGSLSADLRAAAARGTALLADGERALAAFDDAVRASTPPASIRQHVRTLVAYGRFRAARGDAGVAVAAFDRARTLAQLAGLAGWTRGIDTAQTASGGAVASNRWEGLRRDERTMVRLALKGATNSKIAESVFVSERTVVNRLRQVYHRLGIRDRRDLIRLAEECPPRWAAAEV